MLAEQAAAEANRERAELHERLVLAEEHAAEASANAERERLEAAERRAEAAALSTQLEAINTTRA